MLTDKELSVKENELIELIKTKITFDYPIIVEPIIEDNESYYKLSIRELNGLVIYCDNVDDGIKEMKEAKIEWLHESMKKNNNFLLIPNYSKYNIIMKKTNDGV